MIAAGADGGDGLDETDKSILLLLTSNDRGEEQEAEISSLSLIASSANFAKSKRFCVELDFVRLWIAKGSSNNIN